MQPQERGVKRQSADDFVFETLLFVRILIRLKVNEDGVSEITIKGDVRAAGISWKGYNTYDEGHFASQQPTHRMTNKNNISRQRFMRLEPRAKIITGYFYGLVGLVSRVYL